MKTLIKIVAVAGIFRAGLAIGQHQPRFEHVYDQVLDYDLTGSQTQHLFITVIHDRDTGQEIVCVNRIGESSCYLTGRVWK